MKDKHIKVGEIEIPKDYWQLNLDKRKELCETLVDTLLLVLDKQIRPDMNRLRVLDLLLISSIITNEKDENYEICQVLQDLRLLINE
jgi:hypothetical protein